MPHLINILTEVVFILLHFFIFLITYYVLGKKLYQPAVLFSLVWFIILLLHFVFKFTILYLLYDLTIEVYIVFLLGTVCFSAASFLVNKSMSQSKTSNNLKPVQFLEISLKLRIMLVGIIVIGLPFFVKASFDIFIASKAVDFFSGLRSELSYGNADIGPLKYLMSISFVVFAFNLYAFYGSKTPVNRLLLILTFLTLITYAFFTTGRTLFFMILSVYLGISSFMNKGLSIKKYVFFLGLFLIFFIVFGIINGKGGSTDDTLQENIKSSMQGVGVYMVTSLNALDMQLQNKNASMGEGDNTLHFFKKLAMNVGLLPKKKIKSYIQEFVFVPYDTNVYTYYSPYIADFGKIYAWLMLGVFSALQTWLYRLTEISKSARPMFYNAFLLSPLLLSFFGDQYLISFSFWLQLSVFTELFLFTNKLIFAKKW